MSTMNYAICLGYLNNEPVLEHTASGYRIIRAELKCVRTKKTKDDKELIYDYIPVVIWGYTAERIATFCKKGAQLLVTGHLRPVKLQIGQKNFVLTLELSAQEVQFVGPGLPMKAVEALADGMPLVNPRNQFGRYDDGNFVETAVPLFNPEDYAGVPLWEEYPQVSQTPSDYVKKAREIQAKRIQVLSSPVAENEAGPLPNTTKAGKIQVPKPEPDMAKRENAVPSEEEEEDILADAPPQIRRIPGIEAGFEASDDSGIISL